MPWKVEPIADGKAVLVSMNSNKMNFCSPQLLDDWAEVMDKLDSDAIDGVKKYTPVILTSDPSKCRAFSAGLDLKYMTTQDEAGVARYVARFDKLLLRWAALNRRTIALINGHAIAGGFFIGVACDYRVGADIGKWQYVANECKNGMALASGMCTLMKVKFDVPSLRDIFFDSTVYSPRSATESLGYFDILVAEDLDNPQKMLAHMLDSALEIATRLPYDCGAAYAALKRQLLTEDIERLQETIRESCLKLVSETRNSKESQARAYAMMKELMGRKKKPSKL
jgi:enoyl-CoA hydratase/carnithine racemase